MVFSDPQNHQNIGFYHIIGPTTEVALDISYKQRATCRGYNDPQEGRFWSYEGPKTIYKLTKNGQKMTKNRFFGPKLNFPRGYPGKLKKCKKIRPNRSPKIAIFSESL